MDIQLECDCGDVITESLPKADIGRKQKVHCTCCGSVYAVAITAVRQRHD